MILYNVTSILDEEIHADWLHWMQTKHLQDVMDTGCFASSHILKVLDSPNEGVTYCVQFIAETMEKYQDYQTDFAPALRAEASTRFADKLITYRTIMESVDWAV
jgi:hypothetical protein